MQLILPEIALRQVQVNLYACKYSVNYAQQTPIFWSVYFITTSKQSNFMVSLQKPKIMAHGAVSSKKKYNLTKEDNPHAYRC